MVKVTATLVEYGYMYMEEGKCQSEYLEKNSQGKEHTAN